MSTTSLPSSVSFGSSQTGLSTVGYQLLNADGTNNGTRVTAGVYEIGGGSYGAIIAYPSTIVSGGGNVLWDTGGGSPIYATTTVGPGDFGSVQGGITGTAQAGSANTITLAAGDTTADGGYVGQSIALTGGTGKGQAATISGNVSKVATVVTPYANGNWLVNPDATTTYSISGQLPVLQVGVASIPPVIVSNS